MQQVERDLRIRRLRAAGPLPAPGAMTGAPIDYSAATDFLVRVHKGITTGSVRLVSFANADGEGPAKPLFTRGP
jgi:hypothetical protein